MSNYKKIQQILPWVEVELFVLQIFLKDLVVVVVVVVVVAVVVVVVFWSNPLEHFSQAQRSTVRNTLGKLDPKSKYKFGMKGSSLVS